MRQITASLYIGNADDGRRRGTEFDRVVSVAAASDQTTHAHPLADGEHDYEDFAQAVEAVAAGVQHGESVLVHCQAGLSRSVAVAIAALVTVEGWAFDEAYDTCRSGFIHPAPELVSSAERYIANTTEGE